MGQYWSQLFWFGQFWYCFFLYQHPKQILILCNNIVSGGIKLPVLLCANNINFLFAAYSVHKSIDSCDISNLYIIYFSSFIELFQYFFSLKKKMCTTSEIIFKENLQSPKKWTNSIFNCIGNRIQALVPKWCLNQRGEIKES